MDKLAVALETSILLAEKVASVRTAGSSLREKQAMADFATFGLYKQAAIDPQSLARGLGWGVGLGLPALGVGHTLLRDARHQGEGLVRDARNQALLTSAGIGGMQSLGELLKARLSRPSTPPAPMQPPMQPPVQPPMQAMQAMQQPPLDAEQKIAAAILVDDVLEAVYGLSDPSIKHAALVELIKHRSEAVALLRSILP